MKQDRFLIGILAAICLLVVLSLVLFLVRKDTQAYLPEAAPDSAPEQIVNNYVLALQQSDYARAFRYLAEKQYKPTYEQFRRSFFNNQLDVHGTGVRIGTPEISGQEAFIEVTVIHSAGDPFSREWNTTETAVLVSQAEGWRISQMPYPYWGWDWYQPTPEPLKVP